MRYKVILDNGLVQYIDTVRAITHAVVGQHDEAKERPETFQKDPAKLTPEQNSANARHRVRLNSGYYNVSALDWFTSRESAQGAIHQWTGLINVRVVPATKVANG